MAALRTVIGHRLENQKTKYIVFLTFLVLTTILAVYSIMLLFQDLSLLGKSDEPLPSYTSTGAGDDAGSSFFSSDPTDIEIVYPNNDQTASIDNDLEISGISNYDPSNVCHVSVIVNDVKPYKKTIPMSLVNQLTREVVEAWL
jgi:hypothetical protein